MIVKVAIPKKIYEKDKEKLDKIFDGFVEKEYDKHNPDYEKLKKEYRLFEKIEKLDVDYDKECEKADNIWGNALKDLYGDYEKQGIYFGMIDNKPKDHILVQFHEDGITKTYKHYRTSNGNLVGGKHELIKIEKEN
jgi:hypothetical protein